MFRQMNFLTLKTIKYLPQGTGHHGLPHPDGVAVHQPDPDSHGDFLVHQGQASAAATHDAQAGVGVRAAAGLQPPAPLAHAPRRPGHPGVHLA